MRVSNGPGEFVIYETNARQITCDAWLTALTLDTDGLPVSIGRTSRLVPRHMRFILNQRDGGCIYPGCDRPPGWTEAHRIQHWADGGSTSVDNLALLCSRHHHELHSENHQITVKNGRPQFTHIGDSAVLRR